MRQLPFNVSVFVVFALVAVSCARADESATTPVVPVEGKAVITDGDSEKVQYEAGRDPVRNDGPEDTLINDKSPDAEITQMTGAVADDDRDKEEVWGEISQAISGLNDMVGDEMFRDLRRTDENRMEVRVDLNFWQRVRYETRVDLKNDISNIWHLYVLQYGGQDNSSVYFIDDDTNKTIDIFSQFK